MLKGWSQEEFAHKLSMSVPAVSKIERDITDVPFSRLKQISKVLDVSLADLVTESGQTKKSDGTKTSELEKEIISLQKKIIKLLEK